MVRFVPELQIAGVRNVVQALADDIQHAIIRYDKANPPNPLAARVAKLEADNTMLRNLIITLQQRVARRSNWKAPA